MSKNDIRNIVCTNWLLLVFGVSMVFASCALFALGHFTTNRGEAAYICLLYGGMLFIPVCAAVIMVQWLLRLALGPTLESRHVLRSVLFLMVPFLLLSAALNYAYKSQRDKEKAFQKVFAADWPGRGELVYGYNKTVLGDGTFVFVFEASSERLMSLLKSQGYGPVETDSNPDIWRLDLCNASIRALTRKSVQIYSNYECYEKNTTSPTSRFYYDPKSEQVIAIAFRRY